MVVRRSPPAPGAETRRVSGPSHTALWQRTLPRPLIPSPPLFFNGWIQTANGNQGRERFDRRHFPWAVGVGVDYALGEDTELVANYLNQANDEYGQPNENLLEFGLSHERGENGRCSHAVKLALDVGLDGHESTPNLAARLQYKFSFK